jgi:hypothetical protein
MKKLITWIGNCFYILLSANIVYFKPDKFVNLILKTKLTNLCSSQYKYNCDKDHINRTYFLKNLTSSLIVDIKNLSY